MKVTPRVDSAGGAEVDGGVKKEYSDGVCLCADDESIKCREGGTPFEGSSNNMCADNIDTDDGADLKQHMDGTNDNQFTADDRHDCMERRRLSHDGCPDENSDVYQNNQQHPGDESSQAQREQDWEVDDFYTLLDSTLHLSEVDVPSVPVSSKSCEALMQGHKGELQLRPGRLAERIRVLHK